MRAHRAGSAHPTEYWVTAGAGDLVGPSGARRPCERHDDAVEGVGCMLDMPGLRTSLDSGQPSVCVLASFQVNTHDRVLGPHTGC